MKEVLQRALPAIITGATFALVGAGGLAMALGASQIGPRDKIGDVSAWDFVVLVAVVLFFGAVGAVYRWRMKS